MEKLKPVIDKIKPVFGKIKPVCGKVKSACIVLGRKLKVVWTKVADRRFYRYYGAVAVLACMAVLLWKGMDGTIADQDPMSGAYADFSESENEELNTLIENYYNTYASGDTETLQTYASPISASEQSYIQFFSQYVEKYQNLKVYYKRGLDDQSYLVSVYLEIKFVDIDTAAPGLDFFYVTTDDNGNLYIDNTYSSYNTSNGEFEMDTTIAQLIATFEEQEDVLALQAEVQSAYNEAVLNDTNLQTFVSTTLQEKAAEWASNYKAQVAAEEQAAAEQAAAEQAAAEQAAAEQAAAEQAATDAANATTVYTTSKVNVRDSASTDGNSLGQLEAGTAVTKYADEGEWSRIDYNGSNGYVKTEFLSTDANAATTTTTAVASGTTVTLSSTVNIRESMSETASKVALAYQGEQVTVVESYSEGWTKVTYNGETGYIKTEYLN